MTTRRSSPARSRRGTRGPRRRTDWDNSSIDDTALTAGTQGVTDLTAGFYVDLRKGLTVVRMIGQLQIVGAAGGSTEWAAGIAMVSVEAAAAGVFPDPDTDVSFPWMWWQVGFTLAMAVGENAVDKVPIDIRSQRKFRDAGDRLYFIMDNHDVGNTLTYGFGLRSLYKLA